MGFVSMPVRPATAATLQIRNGFSVSGYGQCGEAIAALSAGVDVTRIESGGECEYDEGKLTGFGQAVVISAGLLAEARGDRRNIPIDELHGALAHQLKSKAITYNEVFPVTQQAMEYLNAEWPACVALVKALAESDGSLDRDEIRQIVGDN